MLKTLLASAVTLFAMGSFSAIADTDIGLITFDGAVTDTTCNISTANGESQNNITITLPVVKNLMLNQPPSIPVSALRILNCCSPTAQEH